MELMEYKIVDYLFAWQISVDDVIKIGDELLRVVSVEEDDDEGINIFFEDDYGDVDYESYGRDSMIAIWLPFD